MDQRHVSGRIEPEQLKSLLHDKIDRMGNHQLALLNQVLLQMETEELAEKLGDAFDRDSEQNKFCRIPELMRQFRAGHRYSS